jgi:hypothetical protein
VDGLVGPRTLAAIKKFQQSHVSTVDSRMDPQGPTLTALNRELGTPATVGTKAINTAPPHKPEFLPPDPEIMALVILLLVSVREVIRAAIFRLAAADPFVTTTKLVAPQGPFLENVRQSFVMLEAAFSLGRLNNPRPAFDNIQRVFSNMNVALHRTFDTPPPIAPVLFVPNTHVSMESRAAAYTHRGGAFLTSQDLLDGINEPANRIYVCRNLLTVGRDNQVVTLVHELAHFVSGQPIEVVDVVRRGHMLVLGDRPRFNAIRPEDKIRSAEHYAFFGMVAKTPRFLTEGV